MYDGNEENLYLEFLFFKKYCCSFALGQKLELILVSRNVMTTD